MVGTTISHYRIDSQLGEGGMGVVYKGQDTRLERTVALKFLAPHLVSDEQTKKRFIREARAAAALDHPNIATVFDIDEAEGRVFLAMALVDGRTVKDLIDERPLKLPELLDLALQIAAALQAAHEQGVVHRDIKPANVMVTGRGQVKVMDFGLAQLTGSQQSTRTVLTDVANPLGTPAYMSPEQASGLPTDRRTDIWSLGVTMYEMAAGRRPFAGADPVAVIHAVLNTDPEPLTALRAGVPIELDRIVAKCLARNPAERYQHVDDLIVDLAALRRTIDSVPPAAATLSGSYERVQRRRIPIGTVVLLVTAIAAAALVTWILTGGSRGAPEPALQRTVKFTFAPERLRRGSDADIDAEVSVSPDGKHVTYVEAEGGQLWVRDIDREQPRLIPGATSVYQAFWSPDNRFIAYSVGPGGPLRRISAQGGTPVTITKLAGQFRGGTWSADGETIVYCDTTGLYTVPAAGGSPTQVLEHPHIEQPSFLKLPGGRQAFLFQVMERPPAHEIHYLVAGEQQRHLITSSSSSNPYPIYSPTGHILYVDGQGESTGIWALPFSLATLKATGRAFPVASGSSPKLSLAGTLVYSDVPSDLLQLVWNDRSGKALSTVGAPQLYRFPSLSPDGQRLVVSVREGGPDLWTVDVARSILTRFTFDSASPRLAAWSPSGSEITYARFHESSFDLYSQPASGGQPRVLVSTPAEEWAAAWSPDGRYLVYESSSRETLRDILLRERRTDGSLGDAAVFLRTRFDEGAPAFSPDGTHIAYVSNESGQNEVYVRQFPTGEGPWRVSTNGGLAPRWAGKAKELFYVEGHQLMAVSVATAPRFVPGKPVPLFAKRTLRNFNPQYDVTADGRRFILPERIVEERPLAIHVVHNWFEEFRGDR